MAKIRDLISVSGRIIDCGGENGAKLWAAATLTTLISGEARGAADHRDHSWRQTADSCCAASCGLAIGHGRPGLLTVSRFDAHIGDYRGRTVAVDASSCSTGRAPCAGELVRGEPTAAYLTFTLRMLGLFAEHAHALVFDDDDR